MTTLLLIILQVLSLAIIVRAVLSWLPISPTSRWGAFQSAVRRATDPILRPIRRLLPRAGGIDFAPVVALLAISFILTPIARLL